MNILVLSSGRRNKIIQYLKKELNGNGRVVAADCSVHSSSIYVADEYEIIPKIDDPNYIETVLEVCKKHKINGVLSLIDPELLILSQNKVHFEKMGVTVVGSNYDMINLATDKYLFQKELKSKGFASIPSYIDIEEFKKDYSQSKIDFPVFVKPYDGSSSIGITVVNDIATLEHLLEKDSSLMIQKFMSGKEIGVDVYIDMINGKVCSIFCKEKLLMRSGETDKSVSYYDDKLEQLILEFVKEFPYRGIIDMDIFFVDDTYYISEVNPRFGGGYLHGEEAGFSVMPCLIRNVQGSANDVYQINKNEHSYMYKYSEVTLVKDEM